MPIPEIREHAIDWHGRIMEAVADADPALAREAMRGHLIQTEEDSERYLTVDPGQASGIPAKLPPDPHPDHQDPGASRRRAPARRAARTGSAAGRSIGDTVSST